MDEDRGPCAILIVCMFLWLCITVTNGDVEEEQAKKPSFWEWERFKSAYSIYSKVWSASTWQWQMFQNIVKEAYSRFFSPNLEFRKGGGGAGEKVKEALGKSKAAVEDPATSTGETVPKNTSSEGETQHQNEL